MVSNVRVGLGVTLLLGLTLSALLMFMATAPAQAQTVGVCEGQFNELRANLDPEALPIAGKNAEKERAGLVKLVDDAEALASIGKTSDAVKKLSDFTVKVDQLEAAGRISADSANNLLAKAGAVIDCIAPEEPSPTTA